MSWSSGSRTGFARCCSPRGIILTWDGSIRGRLVFCAGIKSLAGRFCIRRETEAGDGCELTLTLGEGFCKDIDDAITGKRRGLTSDPPGEFNFVMEIGD